MRSTKHIWHRASVSSGLVATREGRQWLSKEATRAGISLTGYVPISVSRRRHYTLRPFSRPWWSWRSSDRIISSAQDTVDRCTRAHSTNPLTSGLLCDGGNANGSGRTAPIRPLPAELAGVRSCDRGDVVPNWSQTKICPLI